MEVNNREANYTDHDAVDSILEYTIFYLYLAESQTCQIARKKAKKYVFNIDSYL